MGPYDHGKMDGKYGKMAQAQTRRASERRNPRKYRSKGKGKGKGKSGSGATSRATMHMMALGGSGIGGKYKK